MIHCLCSSQGDQHLKVNMVAWTVDDELVLTAVSDFSIRVWSSTTGVQLNSLKVKYITTQEVDVIHFRVYLFTSAWDIMQKCLFKTLPRRIFSQNSLKYPVKSKILNNPLWDTLCIACPFQNCHFY